MAPPPSMMPPGGYYPPSPYHYPPFPPPHHQYHCWGPPSPPIEYITSIHPEDVLSGRGGATNSHSGNRAFRSLVKKYQEEYLRAKKKDKPAVASVIVELIRKKGGRFLRRVEDESSVPGSLVRYIDIGDERAREKTCQALREGAPEIRRKKLTSSSDESDGIGIKRSDSTSKDEVARSLSISSLERTLSNAVGDHHHSDDNQAAAYRDESRGSNNNSKGWIRTRLTSEDDTELEEEGRYGSHAAKSFQSSSHGGGDGPIMIRPMARLMPHRPPVEPFPLDHLSPDDRDTYLRDFLPPCPPIRKRKQAPLPPSPPGGHHHHHHGDGGDEGEGDQSRMQQRQHQQLVSA